MPEYDNFGNTIHNSWNNIMKNAQKSSEYDSAIGVNRRRFIAYFSSIGLGSTLLPGTLTKNYLAISEMEFDQDIPPCIVFNPIPPGLRKVDSDRQKITITLPDIPNPKTDEDLAFLPVTHLSALLKSRQITSTDLTKLYISRLKKFDPVLNCVVSYTEDLALAQAQRADEEIAAGQYRGPLHGVPYGLKDIIAVKGYRTTYGAETFKNQVIDTNATVYERLRDAGAVLIAKLSTTALAGGNSYWYKGETKNPWNTEQGTSGSSTGPAAATSAGLVGFSIGTETMGSIINPSSRCGITGLRPTFGRVSRYGVMPLSWTMDKVGPMCRSAEDCAVVFNEIYGADGQDMSVNDFPFEWNPEADLKRLKIGYLKSSFESEITEEKEGDRRKALERKKLDRAALDIFRSLGIDLIPLELPGDITAENLIIMRHVEGAAMFDKIVRDGSIDLTENSNRPYLFRLRRLSPAVEYIQESRARTVLMQKLNQAIGHLDMYLAPHNSAMLTNQTGHPALTFITGFIDGIPASMNIIGGLFKEAEMLAVTRAYQNITVHHKNRPDLS